MWRCFSNRGGEAGGVQQEPLPDLVLSNIFHNSLPGSLEGRMEEAKVDDNVTFVENRIKFKIMQINLS